jgi:S-adenosylmethionine:tRNA ribosyltransferase-isomerase
MTLLAVSSASTFEVPAELIASDPAEIRGMGRDDVKLMVARRPTRSIEHRTFAELPSILSPGDLLVINTSATIPAAVDARRSDGTDLRIHLSTQLPGDLWTVELRTPVGAGTEPFSGGDSPETLRLPAGGSLELLAPYISGGRTSRLWVASLKLHAPVLEYLYAHGRPVLYGPGAVEWPLDRYQTVYSSEPGSAEMPSAGRAFTPEIITALVARGIGVAPIILHTGVSSLEAKEPPFEERYAVPATTARQINLTHTAGARVIAVGTTVVRALETVASESGEVGAGAGWTGLVVTPTRGVWTVDGLLTGWHEPEASHLDLVEAVGGRELIETSYREALKGRYLWHEFGDLHLVLR